MTTHILHTLSDSEPTRLTPNGMHSGMDITIQNANDAGYVYIGGDDTVSSTNYGFRLMPNHSWSVELPGYDHLYAIASTDALKLAVIHLTLEEQG